MVDFANTSITQIDTPITPLPPVVDNSEAIAGSSQAATISGLTNLATGIIGQVQQSQRSGVLANFTQQQLNIADAVDQGIISSQEARTRMRANVQRALADNPALFEDLSGIQKEIVSTSGLGKVVAEGTEAEKQTRDLQMAAIDNGFVNADRSNLDSGTARYIEWLQEAGTLDRNTKRINALKAEIQLGTARTDAEKSQIELQLKQEEVKGRNALNTISGLEFDRFSTYATDTLSQLESGTISAEEAIAGINARFAIVESGARQIGSAAGSAQIENFLSPVQTLRDNTVALANGEITRDVYENQLNALTTRNKLSLLSTDPELQRLVATSGLFGNQATVAIAPQITAKALEILQNTSPVGGTNTAPNLVSKSPQQKSDNRVVLSTLRQNIKTFNSGQQLDNREQLASEIEGSVDNILKGIDVYSKSADTPQEFNELVDFLASPEVGSYLQSNPTFSPDAAENAFEILRQQYGDVVLPVIVREYNNALGATATGRGEIIPEFVGNGVRFVSVADPQEPTPGPIEFVRDILPPAPGTRREQLQSLNREVAPIVNRLVRVYSHLSGNTDYRSTWEQQFSGVFSRGESNGGTTNSGSPGTTN